MNRQSTVPRSTLSTSFAPLLVTCLVLILSLALLGGCSEESSNEEDIIEVGEDDDSIGSDTDPGDMLNLDGAQDLDAGGDMDGGSDLADSSEDGDSDVMQPGGGEHCSNGVDDDEDGDVDCDDDDCDATPPCTAEDCGNGMDDDNDEETDCEDLECASDPACLVEICNNGKDDDGDMSVDCADMDCSTAPLCAGTMETCDNGTDDDGDYRIDCRDSDCWMDMACSAPPTVVPCTAEGQHCDPSDPVQGDFRCFTPPGASGGVCFATCEPQQPAEGCQFGTACIDFNPNDNDPAGICAVGNCSQPFQQDTCEMNQECTPYVNGYLFCDALGTAAAGEACGVQTTCGDDLVCLQGVCKEVCDLSAPSCSGNESCVGLFANVGYGACDEPCPEFSVGQCGEGRSCVATFFEDAWVCRDASERGEGAPCVEASDCQEGMFCAFGQCNPGCSFYANSCSGGDTCVGFDDGAQYGLCGEACPGLLPDTCAQDAERCFQLQDGGAGVCRADGGGEVGDPCERFTDCGAELYCNFQGQCAALCAPFDSQNDRCPVSDACAPFDEEIGGCFQLTGTGTSAGDPCGPANALCGDAVVCAGVDSPQTTCVEYCRASLSAMDGTNPDCGTAGDVCDTEFTGSGDLGLCLSP